MTPTDRPPSVDRVLGWPEVAREVSQHGRELVLAAVRETLDALRSGAALGSGPDRSADGMRTDQGVPASAGPTGGPGPFSEQAILADLLPRLRRWVEPALRRVFNLTGTVLHTNLGRAPLPPEAIEAIAQVATGASNLEFDLVTGRRGDRVDHVEAWLCRLTGAEAATVVNNNAAAVMLALNSLGQRREVVVSRGELVEIGGAFRLPDIMARAGCTLREVGTTNRTHLRDYEAAIGPKTALLMKAHPSNYRIDGFTAEVDARALAGLARARGLPLFVDLGAGALVDLARYGLPHESTPAETLEAGAHLVSFSGDKLLGGPQAGILVGEAGLVRRLERNPMMRAMRCDKMTLAALAAVLPLHADPARLAQRLPTLRLLVRPAAEIEALARRLAPVLARHLGERASVEVAPVQSQIGSGSLPVDLLPSFALRIVPSSSKRAAGRALDRLAAEFRALPVPVVGRVADGAFLLDLRCLEDEAGFRALFEVRG